MTRRRPVPARLPAAIAAFALAAGLWLTSAGPALAYTLYESCDEAIAEPLTGLGLGDDVVRSIYVSPRVLSGRRGDRVTGIDVWVRLKGCAGALVLDLTRHCSITQVYTRGDCRVPGVKAY